MKHPTLAAMALTIAAVAAAQEHGGTGDQLGMVKICDRADTPVRRELTEARNGLEPRHGR